MEKLLDHEAIHILENLKKTHKNKNNMKFLEIVDQVEDYIEERVLENRSLKSGRLEKIIVTIFSWFISTASFFLGVIYNIPFTEIEATVNGADKSGTIKGVASIYMFGFIFIFMPLIYMGARRLTSRPKIKYVVKEN